MLRGTSASAVSPTAVVPAPAGLATVMGLVLAALVLWPLGAVLGAGAGAVGRLEGEVAATLGRTVLAAAMSTVSALTLGFAAAYTVNRTSVPGRALAGRILVLPLILPAFVPALALAWLTGSGRDRAVLPGGLWPLVVAQTLAFLPYAYVILGNALAAIHSDLEDVAESLGAGRARVLWRITLALSRPALVPAAAGVAALCIADMASPLLVGGDYRVLATDLYHRAARAGDVAGAAALGLWLLPLCLLLAAVASGRVDPAVVLRVPAAGHPRRSTSLVVGIPLAVVTGGSALAVAAAPALILIAAVIDVTAGTGGPPLPPLVTSAAVAAAAALAGTVIALAVASSAVAARPVSRRLLEGLALLPAAVPGIVLGLGYLLAFGSLVGGPWLVVGALVTWRLPVAVLALLIALRGLDPAAAEVGLSLGASRGRSLRRLVLPQVLPALVSVFAYFFATALVAVGVVVLLVSPGLVLAPVAALLEAAGGGPGAACTLAAGVSILAGAAVLLRRLVPPDARAAVWFF